MDSITDGATSNGQLKSTRTALSMSARLMSATRHVYAWCAPWLPTVWLGTLLVGTIAWFVGELFRDRWLITGLLFFVPSAFVACVNLLSAVIAAIRKKFRFATIFACLAIYPVLTVTLLENGGQRTNAGTAVEGELYLIHWNVWWGYDDWAATCAHLRELDADAYVLSECPRRLCQEDFPGYTVQRIGGIGFIAKGDLRCARTIQRTHRLELHHIDWESPQGTVVLMGADVCSDVLEHRRPILARLTNELDKTAADILVGDCNSPRRSLELTQLPAGYRHAYYEAGRGSGYTWPTPVPVFAIDQCIVGEKVTPHRYSLSSHHTSDHLLQHLRFHLTHDD